MITVFVLRRYCMRRKNRNFNILIMWWVQSNMLSFQIRRKKQPFSTPVADFFICILSFQSNYCRYNTHHWHYVAKISSTAFPNSGRTGMVRKNISKHLASFERDLVEWNNLYDSCCFNRKISLCLHANEIEDCKYLIECAKSFSHMF